jgi:hypothetical protein
VLTKNYYLLPLMSELRDWLGTTKVFTKIYLKNGLKLLRIAKGDEWKKACSIRFGSYQYNVMPFGLYHAPSLCHAMKNEVNMTC